MASLFASLQRLEQCERKVSHLLRECSVDFSDGQTNSVSENFSQTSRTVLLLVGHCPQSQPSGMSSSTYRLFLGDLSVSCIKEDLIRLLSPFGNITDVQIKQDAVTGKKLCYGFVDFDNIKSALDVLNSMNGYVLCGRPLRVRWAQNRAVKAPNSQTYDTVLTYSSTSVHVSYCSVLHSFSIVTEESLRNLFGTCGFVVDVMIKKSYRHNLYGPHRGYGFVHFQDMESAVNAISSLNNVTVDGILYKVGLSIDMQRSLNTLANTGIPNMSSRPDLLQPLPPPPVYAPTLPPVPMFNSDGEVIPTNGVYYAPPPWSYGGDVHQVASSQEFYPPPPLPRGYIPATVSPVTAVPCNGVAHRHDDVNTFCPYCIPPNNNLG